MGISHRIGFEINATRDRLFELFQLAKVAVHTMEYEHFGIAVVELMSSGIITIAHNSAGPKGDIIGPAPKPVGYICDTKENYAKMAESALLGYDDPFHTEMRLNARAWVKDKFGIEAFDNLFVG